MDGTLAAIFFITGLTDMALNDCPTDCVAVHDATTRLSFQSAAVEFQDDIIGEQLYLGYDFGHGYGPFQPTLGASLSDAGDLWIGAGAKWTSQRVFDAPLFIETSFMPGLHFNADGPDIGGILHFRSALGVGYEFPNKSTLIISYDHRSNGDLLAHNPGLETIAVRYAIALD